MSDTLTKQLGTVVIPGAFDGKTITWHSTGIVSSLASQTLSTMENISIVGNSYVPTLNTKLVYLINDPIQPKIIRAMSS